MILITTVCPDSPGAGLGSWGSVGRISFARTEHSVPCSRGRTELAPLDQLFLKAPVVGEKEGKRSYHKIIKTIEARRKAESCRRCWPNLYLNGLDHGVTTTGTGREAHTLRGRLRVVVPPRQRRCDVGATEKVSASQATDAERGENPGW
jgi:hypothetical protein